MNPPRRFVTQSRGALIRPASFIGAQTCFSSPSFVRQRRNLRALARPICFERFSNSQPALCCVDVSSFPIPPTAHCPPPAMISSAKKRKKVHQLQLLIYYLSHESLSPVVLLCVNIEYVILLSHFPPLADLFLYTLRIFASTSPLLHFSFHDNHQSTRGAPDGEHGVRSRP